MPKTRIHARRGETNRQEGQAIQTKHKIGGRASTRGVKQMSVKELMKIVKTVQPKDRAKVANELERRLKTRA